MTLDREAAKARCEALRPENDVFTTGVPWLFSDGSVWGGNGDEIIGQRGTAATDAEMDFISHARTDLPEALDLLDEKDAALDVATEALRGIARETGTPYARTAQAALEKIGREE